MEKILVDCLFDGKVFGFKQLKELEKKDGDLFYIIEEGKETPVIVWRDKYLILASNAFVTCSEEALSTCQFTIKDILHNNYVNYINARNDFNNLTLKEQIKVFLGEELERKGEII